MPVITDAEFGPVTVRRSAKATQVRIRVAPDGTLRASLPVYAPLLLVKRLLKTSRVELRALLASAVPHYDYIDGMQIGKSHTLVVRPHDSLKVSRHGQQIILHLPPSLTLDDQPVQTALREASIAALRLEAKSYLTKRLAYLAEAHGHHYERVRFSHASGRWGSCSSTGTISLNIALMKLPFELIDYVLLHELAHTKEMNHSPDFWAIVAEADPHYKLHRSRLKREQPSI